MYICSRHFAMTTIIGNFDTSIMFVHQLAAFFSPGIVQHFSSRQMDASVLVGPEVELAATYGHKRRADFCTGRYCLRQCTAPLGYDGPIMPGQRGMPTLPAHITASVSHSRTLAGAIAAPTTHVRSLGLDIETIGRVHTDMWHLLFSPRETEYLAALSPQERALHSTLFFSLKEAFYKAQFPITHTYLDFHDVELIPTNGSFYISMLRHVNTQFALGAQFPASYLQLDAEFITYCAIHP